MSYVTVYLYMYICMYGKSILITRVKTLMQHIMVFAMIFLTMAENYIFSPRRGTVLSLSPSQYCKLTIKLLGT
jgi:hypothetical protein